MYQYVILATMLTTGYSWTLQSTHTNASATLTNDVTLRCFHEGSDNVKSPIDQLTRIRLVKMDSTNTWQTYAQVTFQDASKVLLTNPGVPGPVAYGHLGNVNETFLSVTWSTSFADTVGCYQCEVDGFDVGLGNDIHVTTNVVKITANEVSRPYFLQLILAQTKKTDKLDKESKGLRTQNKILRQQLTNKIEHLESQAAQTRNETDILSKALNTLTQDMAVKSQAVVKDVCRLKSDMHGVLDHLRHWPSGTYDLLTPSDGCPDTLYDHLDKGYFKIQTHTQRIPQHDFSLAIHMGRAVFQRNGSRNDLEFNYCRSKRRQPTLVWPKGTYCINTWPCPAGFRFNDVNFFLESSKRVENSKQNVGTPIFGGKVQNSFNFCCRDDGDVNTPMLLPNTRPFYLFRFKGVCQAVHGSNVARESFHLDTDTRKRNFYGNDNVLTADGAIANGLRLELCYYTLDQLAWNFV